MLTGNNKPESCVIYQFPMLELENATLSALIESLFFDWIVILHCTKKDTKQMLSKSM